MIISANKWEQKNFADTPRWRIWTRIFRCSLVSRSYLKWNQRTLRAKWIICYLWELMDGGSWKSTLTFVVTQQNSPNEAELSEFNSETIWTQLMYERTSRLWVDHLKRYESRWRRQVKFSHLFQSCLWLDVCSNCRSDNLPCLENFPLKR